MSGYKRSAIALEMEREEKLRLLGNISDVRRKLDWLAAKISETLEKTPEGIKTTFGREVKEALVWLRDGEGYRREA